MSGTLDMGEYLVGTWTAAPPRPAARLSRVANALHRRPARAVADDNRRKPAQPKYDLLLRGGHVIDAKNSLSAMRDVAIAAGKVAAVAERIDPADASKTVDVSGLYVTPGLVDIHVHVYAGTGEKGSYAGDNSVYPDGFTFRVRRDDGRRRRLRPAGATSRTSRSASSTARRRASSPS